MKEVTEMNKFQGNIEDLELINDEESSDIIICPNCKHENDCELHKCDACNAILQLLYKCANCQNTFHITLSADVNYQQSFEVMCRGCGITKLFGNIDEMMNQKPRSD